MEIALFNRQRAVQLPVARLQKLAEAAAVECLTCAGTGTPVLPGLSAVEISLVSDRVIARVHRRFMSVPGATDVITFPHGEIVISAATAARQARQHDETPAREVARYIVHGFLHLNGHEDSKQEEAAAMWQAQEAVLATLWPPEENRHHRVK